MRYHLLQALRTLTIAILSIGPIASAKDFTITDFGAVPDTSVLSTRAIQAAIDACAAAGGGRVIVPAGRFKTGSVFLKSHVNLHLESGAYLCGSPRLEDYIPVKPDYLSLRTQSSTIQLIYAFGAEHVSIDGQGTIDGCGHAFKKLKTTDEGITRPHLLRFICCRDASVSGVTLRNSGCWMQHYLACDRVRIHGITVFNHNNFNNDALDIDGCHDVVISDVIADTDDDGLTLKSTSPRLCENVTVTNCIFSSFCNAIKLGTETTGGFRNISISHCIVRPSVFKGHQFYGHKARRGISAISLEMVDGGILQHVHVSDILVEGTETPFFIRLGNRARPYAEGQPVPGTGILEDVLLSHISVHDAGKTGSSITGLPGHPVRNIRLDHIRVHQQGGCAKVAVPQDEKETAYPEGTMWGLLPAKGFFVRHAENVVFEDVTITTEQPDARPDFLKLDVK